MNCLTYAARCAPPRLRALTISLLLGGVGLALVINGYSLFTALLFHSGTISADQHANVWTNRAFDLMVQMADFFFPR